MGGREKGGVGGWKREGPLLFVSLLLPLHGRGRGPARRRHRRRPWLAPELPVVEAEPLELLLVDGLDQLRVDRSEHGILAGKLLVEVHHVLFALLQWRRRKGGKKKPS